jgi:hypothetical protein
MIKTLLAAIYYLVITPLIFNIRNISPTNLAGPGLDLIVYLAALIITPILLIRSIMRRKTGNKYYAYGLLTINIIGSLLVTIALYHIFTMDNYLNH